MKLTNQEIINLLNNLDAFAKKDLPIAITFKMIGNMDKLMAVYNTYDKTRQKVKSDEELIDLLAIENEVELDLIDKNELIESGIMISPAQLVGISRLIDG